MSPTQPADLHTLVESAVNAGDVDALVALYETDAVMIAPDGATLRGLDQIRSVWEWGVEAGMGLAVTTTYVLETGDLALLSNHWTLTIGGEEVGQGDTAEIARRQSDGTWKYVIDNPFGHALPGA